MAWAQSAGGWGAKGGAAKSSWGAKGGAATSKPAAAKAGGGGVALKVSSQSKKGDSVVQTISGDYIEFGNNHNKKTYKKKDATMGVNVFLYYWDTRDGADFSGWWFGDQVGGSNCWAKATVHTPTPPKVGWRVPWDAPNAQPGALIVDLVAGGGGAASTAAAGKAGGAAAGAQGAMKVKKATELLTATEKTVTVAVEAAKKVIANEKKTAEQLKGQTDALTKQQAKLAEVQKTISEETAELRKAGPSAMSHITEFAKLMPKLKALQSSINAEFAKVKVAASKIEGEKKKKEQEAKDKVQAAKELKDFKAALPKVKTTVTAAETAATKVESTVSALLKSPPDEGEARDKKLEEVQTAAIEAIKKVSEARAEVQKTMTESNKYVAEAKKEAVEALTKLTQTLSTAQKVAGYSNIKKDFAQRVEAKKAALEVGEKLKEATTDVENATKHIKDGAMDEDKVISAEEAGKVANATLVAVSQLIASKQKGAMPAMQAELGSCRTKSSELKKKLDEALRKLKPQRDIMDVKVAVAEAKEKVTALETCMATCQDAEMPFLKGVEVLPKAESEPAIAALEKSGGEAMQALNAARTFMKAKLAQAKSVAKDIGSEVTEAIPGMLSQLDTFDKKIQKFKKETAERKMSALLADAIDATSEAEKKSKVVEADAKPLTPPDKLEESSSADIKAMIEKIEVSSKEATKDLQTVKQEIAKSTNELRKVGGSEKLDMVNKRVQIVNAKLSKAQNDVSAANNLIKMRELVVSEGEKLKTVTADVEKAEKPTILGAGLNLDSVKMIDDTTAAVMKTARTVAGVLKPFIGKAPAKTKADLTKLAEEASALIAKVEKLKKDTKSEREEVLSSSYVKEVEAKSKAVEGCVEGLASAEMIFLKGIEVLPLQEHLDAVTASEAAMVKLNEAVSAIRQYMSSKTGEVKAFSSPKAVNDAFASSNKGLKEANEKLLEFKKDTEARKKAAQVTQSTQLVDEIDEDVKKVEAAAKPLSGEENEKLTVDQAAKPLKAFLDVEKKCKENLQKARPMVQQLQKNAGAQADALKKLAERMSAATTTIGQARKAIQAHEHNALAISIVAEVTEKLKELEPEVKKATDFCGPLTVKKGKEYLAHTSRTVLVRALLAHGQAKELDTDGLFKEAGGKKMKEATFVKYLAGLPEALGKEELGFTDERRKEVFALLAKDGSIGKAEFADMFSSACVFRKPTTITDVLDLKEAKTLCQVEANKTVKLTGVVKKDESGLNRQQCQYEEHTGWVTIAGMEKTAAPYTQFCQSVEKAIREANGNVDKVGQFLGAKTKEGGPVTAGPLLQAREEVLKLKTQVGDALKKLGDLKKQVEAARAEFKQTESAELNAHIIAKEKKEAAEIIGDLEPKVNAAVAAFKAVEEAGKDLSALSGDDLLAFGKPATVKASVDKLLATANEAADAAREMMKEGTQAAQKITPPNNASKAARAELQRQNGALQQAVNAARKIVGTVAANCNKIIDGCSIKASAALRKDAASKKISAEAMFKELSKGADKIKEATLAKKLEAVAELKSEHAKLVVNKLEAGGVSLRTFLKYVQIYFTVQREIAITDEFTVGESCKTLRKCEKDELLEVMDGPTLEEVSKCTRVKARALLDGQVGWISIKGSQGTPFLAPAEKPYFATTKAGAPLKFSAAGTDVVRELKASEVLEMVQGPVKEVMPDTIRAKVKCAKENSIGWIVIKDNEQVTYAECNEMLYTCKSAVAMTDGQNLETCKVVRKLAVDEMFLASAEPVTDEASGITRVKGKALKDNKEGWITAKGNKGTTYAESTKKHYHVIKEATLETAMKGGKEVRKLEVGETFQITEGPKTERAPAETYIKVRCLSDDKTGWVNKQAARKWTGTYRCVEKQPLHETKACGEDAKVVTELAKGDILGFVEGPVEEGKVTRVKLSTKDGTVGWASVVNADAKVFLHC